MVFNHPHAQYFTLEIDTDQHLYRTRIAVRCSRLQRSRDRLAAFTRQEEMMRRTVAQRCIRDNVTVLLDVVVIKLNRHHLVQQVFLLQQCLMFHRRLGYRIYHCRGGGSDRSKNRQRNPAYANRLQYRLNLLLAVNSLHIHTR